MSRRLDLGIASYRKTDKLRKTLECLVANSVTDWRCFVVDNASGAETKEIICEFAARNSRIIPVWIEQNIGYAGAVNKILELAETEYICYLDDDAYVQTHGWDEQLCSYLDRFHEVGLIFPNGGAYGIQRTSYVEIMWGVGFCWVLNRLAMKDTGAFDTTLGHQEEADYSQRVRMAGYKCAAAPEIQVQHDATATSDPASTERISRGVVRWVDKWNRYFNGKQFNYHSVNVTRFEDWPPNALYLEEYWKLRLPNLNDAPEVVNVDGRDYDLIRVPRFSGFYQGRVI